MLSVFIVLASFPAIAAPLSWNVEASLFRGTDAGREVHGAPLARATYTLACEETRVTRGWTGWSCSVDGNRIAVERSQGAGTPATSTLDADATFDVKWTPEGSLKTIKARGRTADGVEEWVLLGLASLAVPAPEKGWTAGARTLHDDPALLNLAGHRAVPRSSLELRVIRVHGAGTKIDVFGSGKLGVGKETDLERGGVPEDVTVDVTGTIMLDAAHTVQTRTTSFWLHRRQGSRAGNLGSQRVVVKRAYPNQSSE